MALAAATSLLPLVAQMATDPNVQKLLSTVIKAPQKALKTLAGEKGAGIKKSLSKGKYGAIQNQVNEMIIGERANNNAGVDLVNVPNSSIPVIETPFRTGSTMRTTLTEKSPGRSDPFPAMFEDGVLLEGQELLGVLDFTNWQSGTAPGVGTTVFTFLLNPLQFLDSRLSKIARQYQRYIFTNCEVIYTPDVAATEPGSFAMGWLNDSSLTMPETDVEGIRRLTSLGSAEKFQVFQATSMSKRFTANRAEPYFCRATPSNYVTGNLSNQAKLIVKAASALSLKQYGSLYVKYKLYLYDAFTQAINNVEGLETISAVVKAQDPSANLRVTWSGWPAASANYEYVAIVLKSPYIKDIGSNLQMPVGSIMWAKSPTVGNIATPLYTDYTSMLLGLNIIQQYSSSDQPFNAQLYGFSYKSEASPFRSNTMYGILERLHILSCENQTMARGLLNVQVQNDEHSEEEAPVKAKGVELPIKSKQVESTKRNSFIFMS